MTRRPVTLLTGFLGSGKTTLLNALLRRPELAHTAVVVNEFGEVGIDHLLVEQGVDNVLLLEGGCICCAVSTTLADTLAELLGRQARGEIPPFVRVIVETSGLADPGPILRQLWTDAFVREHFPLDGVVVTVDAAHGLEQLARYREACRQVAVADRIVLTKTDVVDASRRAAVEAAVAGINASAPRLAPGAVTADPTLLLGVSPGAGDLRPAQVDVWLALPPRGQRTGPRERAPAGSPRAGSRRFRVGGAAVPGLSAEVHRDRFEAVAIACDHPVSWATLAAWMERVRAVCGAGLLRSKGIVAVEGEARPVLLQGVQNTFHPPVRLPAWPTADRTSRIVVIFEGVDPAAVRRTGEILDDRSGAAAPGPNRSSRSGDGVP